ncbi:thioredoxin [candidate division KSB1 bacterium]|nr:thioredoxin [candidate division KSB1 bacterium]
MANQITFTDGNFEEEVINSSIPVLVDFWAEWCAPCKMIAPTVDEIAKEFDGKLKVGKVDVDSNPKVSSKYQIRSIPSIVFFKDGKVTDQIVGAVPKVKIMSKIETILE